METKKIFAHAFRGKSIFKILRGRIRKIRGRKYSHKIRHKIRIPEIYILHIYDSCMSNKSKLLKNGPWLITHDLKLFLMISKSRPYVFLTENTIKSKYVENSPFYVHWIEMASETPFVPRGLRWKFCPPGVKAHQP